MNRIMMSGIVLLVTLGIGITVAKAGEATVVDHVVFNTTFDNLVRTFKEHEDDILAESLGGRSTIEERKGDKIKVKVELPLSGKTHRFTLQTKDSVDYRKKKATFTTSLVETDGFVQAQTTEVSIWEKGGKVYVSIKVYAEVPSVPDQLIRFDLNRSIKKMVRVVNQYVQ